MILYVRHIYTNTLNDGKTFVHETKEGAEMAAEQNKEEYDTIAVPASWDVRRCDPCLAEGKASHAFFHKMTNQDVCSDHRKALER